MKKRIIVSLFTGLATLVILTGCASGSHVVTGNQHQPVPTEAVQLYQVAPAHYEIIGMVTAKARGSRQRRMDTAVRQLKHQAAVMGANGIIMNPIETAGLTDRKTVLSGLAIFVLP